MSEVSKICITNKSVEEMQEVNTVEVIASKGIVNDRYFNENNDQALQITLIESENIDNFNKKALYILIREMTDSNTQHITRVINVMKKHHNQLQKTYLATGSIETRWTGSWFNQPRK